MPTYNVPAQSVEVEEVIKNSQFITRLHHVVTAEAAKAFIKKLNQDYPDATHHCWAYIVGNPRSTTLIGCSDDGEPSGTAGKPMLNVLQHADIGDIVAVCTRYYGGTKLGTGGLTRAYGGGVKLALESLPTKEKIDYDKISFEIEYSQLKDCEHLMKGFQIENLKIDYQTKITVELEIACEEVEEFKLAMDNKFKGQIEWITTA
ncbi:YigZ family protein [Aliikangiella coralliicola]|uniref:YigZ family protein n=1 Tax=Aliikangiella coralliicola TaxID=2592383 RepID=A0A545UG31_9GAMM|nr:YigZ family protein [Aliikangiella coralliicola]TQV88428.1 YigZ family protein [Aliikangiella coralliicola]